MASCTIGKFPLHAVKVSSSPPTPTRDNISAERRRDTNRNSFLYCVRQVPCTVRFDSGNFVDHWFVAFVAVDKAKGEGWVERDTGFAIEQCRYSENGIRSNTRQHFSADTDFALHDGIASLGSSYAKAILCSRMCI